MKPRRFESETMTSRSATAGPGSVASGMAASATAVSRQVDPTATDADELGVAASQKTLVTE